MGTGTKTRNPAARNHGKPTAAADPKVADNAYQLADSDEGTAPADLWLPAADQFVASTTTTGHFDVH